MNVWHGREPLLVLLSFNGESYVVADDTKLRVPIRLDLAVVFTTERRDATQHV